MFNGLVRLPSDICRRIAADFGGESREIIALLKAERQRDPALFGDRILRCAVHVAGGARETLMRAIELAHIDYRDLIVWAEYDGEFGERKRDLGAPFR